MRNGNVEKQAIFGSCIKGNTKSILQTASDRAHSFQEIPKSTLHKFQRKLQAELLKNCPGELNRTESCILGALCQLDDFLLNPQVPSFSGTVPRTSRNKDLENREPTGHHSQRDPHPEVEFSSCRTRNSVDLDPEETSSNRVPKLS